MNLSKISITLLLIIFAQQSFAQKAGEILVTKSYYGKTLRNVFDDLALSYNIDIDYYKEDIPSGIIPSKNFRNKPLDEVIQQLLKGKDLHYKIMDLQVVIRKSDKQIKLERKVYQRKSNFTLSGTVKDKKSGESLPFAQIMVKTTTNGTASNVDGYFTLFKVPSDTSVLLVSYTGYKTKQFYLSPKLVSKDLLIELIPETNQIEEVTVTAESEELMKVYNDVSVVSISTKQMKTLPSLGGQDLFRSFQLLPGVSASNESSSGLYVRGGTPDQNLVLYDGFTVYHVDHLFGMFSAFNPNAVKDVKLYKGGFESKYGGRLSSVMEITGKDGNEKNFNMGAGISFLSFDGFAEVPLGENGTFLFTGRRSFQSFLYNDIFDSFNTTTTTTEAPPQSFGKGGGRSKAQSEPSSFFYDLNAKATYKFDKDIFSLSFYNGQDDLDNSSSTNVSRSGMSMSGGRNDLTQWGNWGASGKWSRRWNETFYSNALVSYSKYYSKRDMTRNNTVYRDGETIEINRGIIEDNQLQDYTFKMDNEWKIMQNNQLEFGLQSSYYDIDYLFTRNDTIEIQNRHDIASLSTVYVQDNIRLFNSLTLTPGIRVSYYDVTDDFYFEPRASINYDLTKKIKLKGSWGQYYQFAKRIIRDDMESGSRDFWTLGNGEDIPIGFATHYIGGLSFESHNYLFSAEAYYKDLEGLSEYSLLYAPTFQQQDVDYNEFFYEGTGVAKGVELLAQKKYGKYTGWIGYTLGEVKYDFPIYGDEPFMASHDVTHEFKFVNSYKWKNWVFSGTWIYGTGKPYTAPTGAYDLTMADGSVSSFITIGDKNTFRLPDYHRLDIAATLEFKFGDHAIGNLGFSVFNLYNRTNTWYKTFELVDSELIETDVNLLGITPNITLSFKLR
ncbi:MAG: TonB-dependent receptor [Bacteroidota bacterium]